jgi:hypothetical protein
MQLAMQTPAAMPYDHGLGIPRPRLEMFSRRALLDRDGIVFARLQYTRVYVDGIDYAGSPKVDVERYILYCTRVDSTLLPPPPSTPFIYIFPPMQCSIYAQGTVSMDKVYLLSITNTAIQMSEHTSVPDSTHPSSPPREQIDSLVPPDVVVTAKRKRDVEPSDTTAQVCDSKGKKKGPKRTKPHATLQNEPKGKASLAHPPEIQTTPGQGVTHTTTASHSSSEKELVGISRQTELKLNNAQQDMLAKSVILTYRVIQHMHALIQDNTPSPHQLQGEDLRARAMCIVDEIEETKRPTLDRRTELLITLLSKTRAQLAMWTSTIITRTQSVSRVGLSRVVETVLFLPLHDRGGMAASVQRLREIFAPKG